MELALICFAESVAESCRGQACRAFGTLWTVRRLIEGELLQSASGPQLDQDESSFPTFSRSAMGGLESGDPKRVSDAFRKNRPFFSSFLLLDSLFFPLVGNGLGWLR